MRDITEIPQVELIFLRHKAKMERDAAIIRIMQFDKELARREQLISDATNAVAREKQERK